MSRVLGFGFVTEGAGGEVGSYDIAVYMDGCAYIDMHRRGVWELYICPYKYIPYLTRVFSLRCSPHVLSKVSKVYV